MAEYPLILRYAARSHVGLVRAKNDDSAYAGRYLAVVADGMGGHAGGDVASASTVLDLIHLDHNRHKDDAGTHLADEIQSANSLAVGTGSRQSRSWLAWAPPSQPCCSPVISLPTPILVTPVRIGSGWCL